MRLPGVRMKPILAGPNKLLEPALGPQVIADGSGTPHGAPQQVLHPVGRRVAGICC